MAARFENDKNGKFLYNLLIIYINNVQLFSLNTKWYYRLKVTNTNKLLKNKRAVIPQYSYGIMCLEKNLEKGHKIGT